MAADKNVEMARFEGKKVVITKVADGINKPEELINRALSGLASIENGNYDMMAAVMIGGMVPPLAIALACTLFKDRWTETELKSAPVNYIMGLSFITEGAIPYAAADPLLIPLRISFGLGEYSVSATSVLATRKQVSLWTKAEAGELAAKVMQLKTAAEIHDALMAAKK